MLWALPLLPVAGALAIAALRGRPRAHPALALATLGVTLGVAAWAAAAQPAAVLGWGPVLGLHVAAGGFARVMVVLVPAVAAPIAVYAAATEADGRGRLLALMVGFVGAMELVVIAADFLTLLVSWELIGAASWSLIGHGWRDADTGRAAAQAFVTTRVGDLGLYLAAGMAFAGSGSFAFARLGATGHPQLEVVAGGVLVAAAAKSAQVPFSPWLFSAMAGPTPVSALLHSATLVAAGAFLLVRLAPVLTAVGWFGPAVIAVGLTTALAGGVVAATQTHAKRVLAGSTSAQYGLMFVAVGAGSTAAAGAQLVTHAAFKSLLFLGAGVAMHAAGTGELGGMRLGRALPRAAVLSGIGALALAAVPPLGGAWSKEQIVGAAVEHAGWLGAGVLVAALLTALYASRYQLLAYGPAPDGAAAPSEHHPGRVELAGPAVLAAGTLALSVLWLPGAAGVVARATAGRLPPGAAWEQALSLALLAAGVAVTVALWRRGRLVTLALPAPVQRAGAGWLGLPAASHHLVVDPVLALARVLARFDDRVIDAGVRAVVWLAARTSRLLDRRAEWSIDGAVRGVAGGVLRLASGSRVTDERAVDGVLVEGTAGRVGAAGRASRRLQTGLSHHYYVFVAAGASVVVAVLAGWR